MKHLYQKKIKHKARVREEDRKSDGKRVGDLRDDSNRPFKRSDGYWYVWINDGRGVDLPKLFPEQIYGTGGLAFLAKANVNVDYNRYALNPSYTITVEWNNQ